MTRATRIRRTPEHARSIILDTAAKRLADHGLKGLNIKDIANDTGINHGTILHHFGSADQMRAALLSRMTQGLVEEMSRILSASAPPETVFEALFSLMSQSGHIKLIAWRAMEDVENIDSGEMSHNNHLFQEITQKVLEQLQEPDVELARNMIFLAFSSAVGWGICGSGFQRVMGLSEDQQDKFPAWVGSLIPKLRNNNDI